MAFLFRTSRHQFRMLGILMSITLLVLAKFTITEARSRRSSLSFHASSASIENISVHKDIANCKLLRNTSKLRFLNLRGGGDGEKIAKIDKKTLQDLLAKASTRHNDAVRAARDSYWSVPDGDIQDTNFNHILKTEFLLSLEFDSYGMDPSCSWTVPDFANVFHSNKNSIHVTSQNTQLFTPEECQYVINKAEQHFKEKKGGEWTTLQSGRFPVNGFWIKDIPQVHEWFNSMLRTRLFPALTMLFPEFVDSIGELCCDNAYLFKYTPETGERTDVHTDSGCLSFTIALNEREKYEGGGTWFETLVDSDGTPVDNGIINMDVGHVTFRPGGVRHRGDAVTKGVRYIIGGFVMHKHKVEYVRMLTGLGMELAQKGKYEEAEEALKGAIVLNPKFDAAYINLADVLAKAGKEKEAMAVLEEGRKVNPRNGEAAYTLGIMKRKVGEREAAKSCFDSCLEVDKWDAEAMMAQAALCNDDRDVEGERAWFAKVISTPNVKKQTAASAYVNLGVMLGEQGDNEGEIAMYSKALKLSPNNLNAQYSLGSAYGDLKMWDKAIDAFKLAVKIAEEQNDKDRKIKGLEDLYRVAIMKVNSDPIIMKNKSQADMLNWFMEIMGEKNYKTLMERMRKR